MKLQFKGSVLDPFARAPDGQKMMVLRPENPALAIELANKLLGSKDEEEFDKILQAQPYLFVGYSARSNAKKILDEDGKIIGELQPGDSFVSEKSPLS